MFRLHGIFTRRAYLLLALLLLGSQTTALAHAYEHEVGAPASLACSDCLTASQLTSVCVGNPDDTGVPLLDLSLHQRLDPASSPVHAVAARERGPPQPL
jgi:hypothetical protein